MTELDNIANALFILLIIAFAMGAIFTLYFTTFLVVLIHRSIMRRKKKSSPQYQNSSELIDEVSLSELGIEAPIS